MAQFPTSLPLAGSASSSATLAAAGHTALHNNDRDEIRAVATKVGTGPSIAASGQVLRGTGAGTSGWGAVNLAADVTGILPVGNGGTGTTSTTGSGAVVYNISPSIINPTISGGGSWAGSPNLSTPTIADFTNSQHDHSNAVGGGTLNTSILNNPYKFSAYRAAALSPTGAVIFDTEEFDTGNNYDISNGRFTAPVAGFYQFNAQLRFTTTTSVQNVGINLLKNGVTFKEGMLYVNMYAAGATSINGPNVATLIQLAAADYIQVSVINSPTLALSVAGGAADNYFQGYMVCAT